MRFLPCERTNGILESFLNSLPDSKPVGCSRRVCSYVPARYRAHGYLKPCPMPLVGGTLGSAPLASPMGWPLAVQPVGARP
jgi:hypothetical protein